MQANSLTYVTLKKAVYILLAISATFLIAMKGVIKCLMSSLTFKLQTTIKSAIMEIKQT